MILQNVHKQEKVSADLLFMLMAHLLVGHPVGRRPLPSPPVKQNTWVQLEDVVSYYGLEKS